jgi:sarcosine oxidase
MNPPDAAVRRHVTRFVAAHFPGVDARAPALVEPCLYTMSPDHAFVIDAVPGTESRVWLVSACSGHGFKFGSLLGRVMADLATSGVTDAIAREDLARFSLSRFGDKVQVASRM